MHLPDGSPFLHNAKLQQKMRECKDKIVLNREMVFNLAMKEMEQKLFLLE